MAWNGPAESAWTCPESVKLQDGTWMNAPWLTWDGADSSWKCWMCNGNSGTRVTNDHLESAKHLNRTTGPHNQWKWYTRQIGQKIVNIEVHADYKNPSPGGQLALPAHPPASAAPGPRIQLPAHPPPAPDHPPPAAAPAPAAPPARADGPPGLQGDQADGDQQARQQADGDQADGDQQARLQQDMIAAILEQGRQANAQLEHLQTLAELSHATCETQKETNDYLERISERLQLVADRIAQTNELLNTMNGVPRGNAVHAVRARGPASVDGPGDGVRGPASVDD